MSQVTWNKIAIKNSYKVLVVKVWGGLTTGRHVFITNCDHSGWPYFFNFCKLSLCFTLIFLTYLTSLHFLPCQGPNSHHVTVSDYINCLQWFQIILKEVMYCEIPLDNIMLLFRWIWGAFGSSKPVGIVWLCEIQHKCDFPMNNSQMR